MNWDPLWSEAGGPASPYPGWMLDNEGQAYESQVAQRFLTAMSSLAATVCVIAASTPAGERHGMTATAVCSLSTSPPQLVACLNRGSSMARALVETGWFSVNLLAGDQEALAATFAGRTGKKGDERFEDDRWTEHATGAPVLRGAAAACICHMSGSLPQSSHLVVIGQVLDVELPMGEPRSPLMYHLRRFTSVEPPPAAPHSRETRS